MFKEKNNKKVKKKTSGNPLGRHVVSPLFVIILIFLFTEDSNLF